MDKMTDHQEIIELLEKAKLPENKMFRTDKLIDQALTKLRTAQEPCKTCMCMDCGKVIKVTEQSKHLKECSKEPKPVLPPATGKRQQGHSQLKFDPKLKTLVSVDPHPDCTAQEQPDTCSHCDKEIDISSEGILTDSGELLCMECQEPVEPQTRTGSCPKCGEDWRTHDYACKVTEQPPASELTDWLRKTISGDRYEKGDPELQAKVREACDIIDQRQEQPPTSVFTKEIRKRWLAEAPHQDSTLDYAICAIIDLCARLDRAEAEIKQARDVAFRWQQIAQERKERADKADVENKRLFNFAKKLCEDDTDNLDYWAEEYLHAYNVLAGCLKMQDKIELLEAKLKAKDELLFAYESVNAPVNPLLAINKDLRDACKMVSNSIFRDRDGEWQLSRPIELLKVITDEAIAKHS